jgi:hypothetical protein
MQISQENMEEFRGIYKEQFGIYLLEQDAYEIASNLVRLYTQIYSPLPSEQKDTPTESVPGE